MKISNEELKQIIKEELEIVLNEAFGLRHLALGPMGGTLYGAMKGKKKSAEEPERPLYRDRYDAEAEAERYERERLAGEQEAENQRRAMYPKQVADILSQQGIIAIPDGSGIKIKGIMNPDGTSRSGRDARLYAQVNTDLSLEEAAADVIDQIRGRDPEAMGRSSRKMMRQGRSSINIDDPMMEGRKRRIKRKLTNKQLKQIIKEELVHVLDEISTPEMAKSNPNNYSKETDSLVKKLLSGEIKVEELDDVQIQLMKQVDWERKGAQELDGSYDRYQILSTDAYNIGQKIKKLG